MNFASTRHKVLRDLFNPALALTPRVTTTAGLVSKRYGFPTLTAPWKEGVALIELGGGWLVSDVQAYCTRYSLPTPPIKDVLIGGGKNAPTGDPNGPDGEQALDIQVVLGATGGLVPIYVYQADNSDAGFAQAVAQVAKDGLGGACGISWGMNERGWQASGMQAMNAALLSCVGANVTCFAASGDDGSRDGAPGNNSDFPASSPYTIGCGGTSIPTGGGAEVAWSYGGGGLSVVYPRPPWQAIGGNARGIPDVAGNADPNSGYATCVDGKWSTIGGTSAVAPLWAALKVLLDATAGKRLKLDGALLYKVGGLTDITGGSNGAFKAAVGWDPTTGLGVPNATFMQNVLAAAGGTPPPPPPPGTFTLPQSIILPPGIYQTAH